MAGAHRSARRLTGQGGQSRALLGFETEQRGQGSGAVGVERTRREALILSTGGERLEGREHTAFLAYPAPSSVLPCRQPPPRRPGVGPLPQCPSAPPHRARTPAWPRRAQRPPHLRARSMRPPSCCFSVGRGRGQHRGAEEGGGAEQEKGRGQEKERVAAGEEERAVGGGD
jgi:hypothetical protein